VIGTVLADFAMSGVKVPQAPAPLLPQVAVQDTP